VWHKTILHDAAWYTDSVMAASSNSAHINTVITVLLPFHDEYLPYLEWKQSGMQVGHFTMSNGDYIILGEVEEDFTASTIVKELQKYGENVCTVKQNKLVHDRFNASVQLRVQGV
jgi:hypothetical protein